MKNFLFTMLILSLLLGFLNASENQNYTGKIALKSPLKGNAVTSHRDVPSYTFTKTPTSLLTSYYDYMIGSYNSLPIRVIPDVAGGVTSLHIMANAHLQVLAEYSIRTWMQPEM